MGRPRSPAYDPAVCYESARVIVGPFLLYIGRIANPLDIKTSRGMAVFRREDCVGEFRHDDGPLTLGLPRFDFAEAVAAGARTLILGVAAAGGRMDATMIADVVAALDAGLDVAAGLHQRLRDAPAIAAAAQAGGRKLYDVRDPAAPPQVGTGQPRAGRRLLTVGTDCAVGKMYTALHLTAGLRSRGVAADFRATGQTGIMIAGAGVPIDAVVADFLSGAVEWLSPARHDNGWDVIEGQGSLFHPSFAGVSTGLLHGAQPDAVVLCHDPLRTHLRGLPHMPVPDIVMCLDRNLAVARLTNPMVQAVGVSLNTARMAAPDALALCGAIADRTGLPCVDPVTTGVAPILDRLSARAIAA
nr:N-acetyltransferase DgcN [Sphingomonas insulae]